MMCPSALSSGDKRLPVSCGTNAGPGRPGRPAHSYCAGVWSLGCQPPSSRALHGWLRPGERAARACSPRRRAWCACKRSRLPYHCPEPAGRGTSRGTLGAGMVERFLPPGSWGRREPRGVVKASTQAFPAFAPHPGNRCPLERSTVLRPNAGSSCCLGQMYLTHFAERYLSWQRLRPSVLLPK